MGTQQTVKAVQAGKAGLTDMYGHIKVAALLQVLHGDVLVALLLMGLLCRLMLVAAPIPGSHPT